MNAPPTGKAQCERCGSWPKMKFRRGVKIDGRSRKAATPVLVCPKCDRVTVPDIVRRAAREAGTQDAELFPHREFGLCAGMGFRYSSADWDVIPRLRQSAHDPDGHYAPVFFDQRALLKYMVRPEYAMAHFKDGGTVIFADGSSLKYGITRSGRMVCWLGDLDGIPEKEQHHLLSDNLESDHDVASWLYRDRLGMPAEASEERRLAQALFSANRAAQGGLGRPLWLLGHREVQILHGLARPVIWNEFVSHAINNLNKALIEAIDRDFLRAELEGDPAVKRRGEGQGKGGGAPGVPAAPAAKRPGERKEERDGKGHVRYLEEFLGARFGRVEGRGLEAFRTLRNWRNSLDHVTSGSRGGSADWQRIRALPPSPEYERVYDGMLAGLVGELGEVGRLLSRLPAGAAGGRPGA